MKTKFGGLCLEREKASKIEVRSDSTGKNELIYDLSDGEGATYRICHVNGVNENPEPVDFEGYSLVLDTLGEDTPLSESTQVSPYQTLIGRKIS